MASGCSVGGIHIEHFTTRRLRAYTLGFSGSRQLVKSSTRDFGKFHKVKKNDPADHESCVAHSDVLSALQVFGSFALINVAQIFVAPIVVLNYCLISCVENFVNSEVEGEAVENQELGNRQEFAQAELSP